MNVNAEHEAHNENMLHVEKVQYLSFFSPLLFFVSHNWDDTQPFIQTETTSTLGDIKHTLNGSNFKVGGIYFCVVGRG